MLVFLNANLLPSILCFPSGKYHCCSLQGTFWSSCAAIELIHHSKWLCHYVSLALLYFPLAQAQDLSVNINFKHTTYPFNLAKKNLLRFIQFQLNIKFIIFTVQHQQYYCLTYFGLS